MSVVSSPSGIGVCFAIYSYVTLKPLVIVDVSESSEATDGLLKCFLIGVRRMLRGRSGLSVLYSAVFPSGCSAVSRGVTVAKIYRWGSYSTVE